MTFHIYCPFLITLPTLSRVTFVGSSCSCGSESLSYPYPPEERSRGNPRIKSGEHTAKTGIPIIEHDARTSRISPFGLRREKGSKSILFQPASQRLGVRQEKRKIRSTSPQVSPRNPGRPKLKESVRYKGSDLGQQVRFWYENKLEPSEDHTGQRGIRIIEIWDTGALTADCTSTIWERQLQRSSVILDHRYSSFYEYSSMGNYRKCHNNSPGNTRSRGHPRELPDI